MLEPCPGCGALFLPSDGPTHRYIGASAGCWALYAPLSAGQPPDSQAIANSRTSPRNPPPLPRAAPGDPAPHEPMPSDVSLRGLLVDAYAAQHPGVPAPQAVQSVAVHLLTLHGILRRGVDPAQSLWVRRRSLRARGVFRWLDPALRAKSLTIRHLFSCDAIERPCTAGEYVRSVYEAWETGHGETIVDWYERYVFQD